MSKAIEELIKIASIEGINPNMGAIAREEAIRQWIKENLVEMEMSQSIIKKALTYEDERFIKTYVTNNIAEELYEDCIDFKIEKTKISAKLLALKR